MHGRNAASHYWVIKEGSAMAQETDHSAFTSEDRMEHDLVRAFITPERVVGRE
jgi:hypothetical protein